MPPSDELQAYFHSKLYQQRARLERLIFDEVARKHADEADELRAYLAEHAGYGHAAAIAGALSTVETRL
jgi:uncharacterized protein YozE (UPF0346 family)